jgi:hypothetical protein
MVSACCLTIAYPLPSFGLLWHHLCSTLLSCPLKGHFPPLSSSSLHPLPQTQHTAVWFSAGPNHFIPWLWLVRVPYPSSSSNHI